MRCVAAAAPAPADYDNDDDYDDAELRKKDMVLGYGCLLKFPSIVHVGSLLHLQHSLHESCLLMKPEVIKKESIASLKYSKKNCNFTA